MLIDLEQEGKRLEKEINQLETQIAPLQKELQQKREELSHIRALHEARTRKASNSLPPSKVEPWGFWKKLCREHGLYVGRDSAHRVVARKDPGLHRSIPHYCDYDQRAYP